MVTSLKLILLKPMSIIAAIFLSFIYLAPVHIKAAAGSFTLNANSNTVTKGSSVKVDVSISPNTPIDGVELDVTYDSTKLELSSVDNTNSGFPIQLLEKDNSGNLNVVRGILGDTVSTKTLISSLTFKSLKNGGNTSVKVGGNATYAGEYTDPAGTQIELSLGSKPKSQTPSRGGSNGSSNDDDGSGGGGGGGNTDNPGRGNKKDSSLEVSSTETQFTTAKVKVKSKRPAKSYTVFGTEKDKLNISTKPVDVNNAGDIEIQDDILVPGVTYYYKVVAEFPDGEKTESEVGSFTTKGYTVKLSLKDSDGNSLADKDVTLFSEPKKAKTDNNGAVVFKDVAPGQHRIEYKEGGETYTKDVNVAKAPINTDKDGNQSAEVQSYVITYEELSSIQRPVVLQSVTSAAILATVAALVYFTVSYKKSAYAKNSDEVFQEGPISSGGEPQTPKQDNQVKKDTEISPGSMVEPSEENRNKEI